MINYIELVIPIDREWLLMLDRIALPISQLLPKNTPYFFTNDEGKILLFRLEERVFEKYKEKVYNFLLKEMQSEQKIKIYKQHYALEEARFGKISQPDLHTNMFFAGSQLIIKLLEEADGVQAYENRMPYAVIAIHYLMINLTEIERNLLRDTYIQHWIYFNEIKEFDVLMKFFMDNYREEIQSLTALLLSLSNNADLYQLYEHWAIACHLFISDLKKPAIKVETAMRDKTYHYKNNSIKDPRTWEVIADQIHLLLNKFGMLNEDETLLVFLTQKAMVGL